jgi:hypothetical protein
VEFRPVLLGRQRGFAVAELLTSLILLGILGTVVVRTILSVGRTVRGQQERAGVESAFDLGTDYLGVELAGVARGDLISISRESVIYRAVRMVGLACLVADSEVRVLEDRLSAIRLPQPGRDSLLLYTGADSVGAAGRGWVSLPLAGLTRSSCGTSPALRLATSLDSGVVDLAALPMLVPVRTFEVMEARFYSSLGSNWLGARSVTSGEAVQPLAGPFEATGTGFEFLDSAGVATVVPAAARTLRFSLTGRTVGWDGTRGVHVSSAATAIAPENLQ